jgi:hypothetical protein
MLSYLGAVRNSVGPRDKDLPSTPERQTTPPSDEEEKKLLTPSQMRLADLGTPTFLLPADVSERKQAALMSQHVNLSHIVNNLENLLPPNPATHDPIARTELERKLEDAKREKSGVEKEKMEVGILITRLRRKLDDEEGRGDKDSFIWSRKWASTEE